MIEVLSIIYLSSLVLSACLIGWQYLFICKQLDSVKLSTLNANLGKIGLFWENAKGDFSKLEEGSITMDRLQTKRSLLYTGLLGFGSLPGLLLLTSVIFSLRYLAKPRREISVFKSDLVTNPNLTAEDISNFVELFKKIS